MLRTNHILKPAFVFLLMVLGMWEIIPLCAGIPKYVFPRLSDCIIVLLTDWEIISNNSLITIVESLMGFVIGGIWGLSFGCIMARWKLGQEILLPYIVGSNSVPIVAVAPILTIWFGHGIQTKVLVAAFLCFFPTAINTYYGLINFSPVYYDLYKVFGASTNVFFIRFQIRNAQKQIFSGLKMSATFSVIGAVVAEFVGSDRGLGYGMVQASYSLNTPRLYAYLIIACAFGMFMYWLVGIAEHLLFLVERKNEISKGKVR